MLAKNAKRIENVKEGHNLPDDVATEKKEENDNVEMTVKPDINNDDADAETNKVEEVWIIKLEWSRAGNRQRFSFI